MNNVLLNKASTFFQYLWQRKLFCAVPDSDDCDCDKLIPLFVNSGQKIDLRTMFWGAGRIEGYLNIILHKSWNTVYTIHSTTPQETSYTSNFLLFSFQFKLPSNWLCTRIFIKGKGYKSSNCFKRVQILIKTTDFYKNIICILGNIHTVLFDDGFILFLKVWKIYVEADFNFEPWSRSKWGRILTGPQ